MKLSRQPLISAAAIAERVRGLGAELADEFRGKRPLVLGVLNGAALFTADLVRAMDIDLEIEFIHARSYAGTESTGRVILSRAEDLRVTGRSVLLVEDIVDTGRTLAALLERLRGQDPSSVTLCSLLDKPSRRIVPVQPDFTGFTIDDLFVVGYGLDYNEHYRNLPDIRLVAEE